MIITSNTHLIPTIVTPRAGVNTKNYMGFKLFITDVSLHSESVVPQDIISLSLKYPFFVPGIRIRTDDPSYVRTRHDLYNAVASTPQDIPLMAFYSDIGLLSNMMNYSAGLVLEHEVFHDYLLFGPTVFEDAFNTENVSRFVENTDTKILVPVNTTRQISNTRRNVIDYCNSRASRSNPDQQSSSLGFYYVDFTDEDFNQHTTTQAINSIPWLNTNIRMVGNTRTTPSVEEVSRVVGVMKGSSMLNHHYGMMLDTRSSALRGNRQTRLDYLESVLQAVDNAFE